MKNLPVLVLVRVTEVTEKVAPRSIWSHAKVVLLNLSSFSATRQQVVGLPSIT